MREEECNSIPLELQKMKFSWLLEMGLGQDFSTSALMTFGDG